MLRLYERLLALRRSSPALRAGSWEPRDAGAGCLAYERRAGRDRKLVALNLTGRPCAVELGERARVVLSTGARRDGEAIRGRLALDGDEGVIADLGPED
jgi:alpha-glucosidase